MMDIQAGLAMIASQYSQISALANAAAQTRLIHRRLEFLGARYQ